MEKVKSLSSFDVKKEFFLFDSETLDCVQTSFYGFTIDNGRLIERIEDLKDQSLFLSCNKANLHVNDVCAKGWPSGVGCYIWIKKDSGKVLIGQDFLGSYGIYLYRDGDYFALSNSFLYLVEYIEKTAHPLSMNRDYANSFLVSGLCSVAYSETMVNEIQLLARNAVVEIDVTTKNLELRYLDYEENSLEISSEEGISLLDDWYNRWTTYIQNLKSQNEDIRVDLSGGMDSRLTFLLLLGADIDLSEIYVNSIEDKLHTHVEDFEIATEISKFYQFSLNNTNNLHHKCVNYTMDDILKIAFYTKLGFHKQMGYHKFLRMPKQHYFGGGGGECVRNYWNISESDYTEQMVQRCHPFPNSPQLECSVRTLLRATFESIKKKFADMGRSVNAQDMTSNLYRETRCRNHFGKDVVENYFGGVIKYSPLLDPQLHKLKLNDQHCQDKNLLIAVIFDRYQRKLLDFKFEGKRCIDEQTLKYAETINHRFPRREVQRQKTEVVHSLNRIAEEPSAFSGNPGITMAQINKYVEDIFYSRHLKGSFLSLYDEDTYAWIVQDIQSKKFMPLENAYVAIAIAAILQSVYTNETLNQGILSTFTNPGSLDSRVKKKLKEDPYLDNYITARVDIKNSAQCVRSNHEGNDIQIIEITDHDAKINAPAWFAKNGKGYVIESQAGKLTVIIKCVRDGKLSIALRGRDVRDKAGERVPFWIDFHSMTYNSEKIFDTTKPVWHNEAFSFSRAVEDGEIIMLRWEWGPHKP